VRDCSEHKKRKPENPPGFPPFFSLVLRANSKCEIIAQPWQISGSTAACTIKCAALPECHTYSIWRLAKKKAPNCLMQLGRSEALFCALRREGSRRKTDNVTARRGALDKGTSPEPLT
jgi:hypothetical protein